MDKHENMQPDMHDQHKHHEKHSELDMHMEHSTHDMSSQSMDHSAHDAHDEHAGHGMDHTGHEKMFRTRFWWSLLFSLPVLIYSPFLQRVLSFTAPAFPGSEWVPFVFSLVIFGYGGVPFIQLAVPEIRNRKPGMMTLITLAISVAFIYSYSLLAQLANLGEGFFWKLVTLIDVMLLGHWLEMRSVRQASGALNELAKLMPDEAERIKPDGSTETTPTASLWTGDLLLVRPGGSVPADGEVTEGQSSLNESMITGESRPVKKDPGSNVIAGTINGDGSLRARVTATGDETALAGIMRLVEQAQKRVARNGWKNVTLIQRDAAAYRHPAPVKAVISTYALSIFYGLDQVLNNLSDSLLPGGRLSLLELQIPSIWPTWLAAIAVDLMRPFALTDEWVHTRPWELIQESIKQLFKDVIVVERYFGLTYIISGIKPLS